MNLTVVSSLLDALVQYTLGKETSKGFVRACWLDQTKVDAA